MDFKMLAGSILNQMSGNESDEEVLRIVQASGLPPEATGKLCAELIETQAARRKRDLAGRALNLFVPGAADVLALCSIIRKELSGNESREQIEQIVRAAGVPQDIASAVLDGLLIDVPTESEGVSPELAAATPPQIPDQPEGVAPVLTRPPPLTEQAATTAPPPLPVSTPVPPALTETIQPAIAPASAFAVSTTPGAVAEFDSHAELPRLIVHWGTKPEIGHAVRPQFLIAASGNYTAPPRVSVNVDQALDHDATQFPNAARGEGDGLWGFHAPFSLTTNHQNCRPGQYLIELSVTFPPTGAVNAPRCYRSAIRLSVSQDDEKQTLEITGDGQSVVNLNGQDLKRFGRVILKGTEAGIINLQGGTGVADEAADDVTHEYALQVDEERQSQIPQVRRANSPSIGDAASLKFADGRQILLLARRHIRLGRNRENDIVTRFMPRCDKSDDYSRKLSRTHMTLTLTDQGLTVADQSTTGVNVDSTPVDGDFIFAPHSFDDAFELHLGVSLDVDMPFVFEARMFGAASTSASTAIAADWDELYCDALTEPVPRLWKMASAAGIDSLRLRRRDGLRGQEEYVTVFRQAWLGSSPTSHAILIPTAHGGAAARLLYLGERFWIEALSGGDTVTAYGQPLAPRQLVELTHGVQITIAGDSFTFGPPEQVGL